MRHSQLGEMHWSGGGGLYEVRVGSSLGSRQLIWTLKRSVAVISIGCGLATLTCSVLPVTLDGECRLRRCSELLYFPNQLTKEWSKAANINM